MQSNSKIDKV